MRPIDWTDYRQALNDNNLDKVKAVEALKERWAEVDVLQAQKEFERRVKDVGVKAALDRQNNMFTSGAKHDIDTLNENSKGIAEMIKAGTKKPQQ